MLGDDLAGGLDAIKIRHLDIHEHDIRCEGAHQRDGFSAICRLADDGHAFVCVQQSGQARSK